MCLFTLYFCHSVIVVYTCFILYFCHTIISGLIGTSLLCSQEIYYYFGMQSYVVVRRKETCFICF